VFSFYCHALISTQSQDSYCSTTLLEPFEQIEQAFHFEYMPLLYLCSSSLLQLAIDSRNYYFTAAIAVTGIA
jgi:hypothetical protein